MATTSTWTAFRNVVWHGNNFANFTAGEAINAGAVVGMAATGVSMTVVNMNNTAGEFPIGVAITTVASGEEVSVAMTGCIVYVREGAGNTIDAGDFVTTDAADSTITGCVTVFTPRADLASATIDATNDTTVDETTYVLGVAMDDFTANGSGRILIMPHLVLWSDHTVV